MTDLGRMLLVIGALLMVVGIIVIAAGRMNLPLGRLPGDVTYRGKNTTVYFPLATSIIVSIVLSVILYLVNHFRR